jgi:hypothetical protein
MADILIDNEGYPTTPTSGKSLIYVDSITKKLCQMDDSGKVHGIISTCGSTAAQGAIAATEVYLTGSGILIPSCGMQVGMMFIWHISASKTAASTAAPVWTWRIGAAQTTGDTSRLALTAVGVQIATLWDGILTACVRVHIASAVGTIAGSGGSAPDFGGGGSGTSSTFDNTATIAGQYIGLTITGGTGSAWTINAVSGYLIA